jgi:hypothetical protein
MSYVSDEALAEIADYRARMVRGTLDADMLLSGCYVCGAVAELPPGPVLLVDGHVLCRECAALLLEEAP